jgi:hypothetical protein
MKAAGCSADLAVSAWQPGLGLWLSASAARFAGRRSSCGGARSAGLWRSDQPKKDKQHSAQWHLQVIAELIEALTCGGWYCSGRAMAVAWVWRKPCLSALPAPGSSIPGR